MIDALFELTALPNLHPAVVHFPIALASVALLFDAAGFLRWRWAPADLPGQYGGNARRGRRGARS